MTADECREINESIDKLASAINEFKLVTSERLTAVEVKVANKKELCPWREDIARFEENGLKLESIETRLHAIELTIARAGLGGGLAGGGIVGVIGGTLVVVGKALGWW